MKTKSIVFTLSYLLLFTAFAVPAMACCDPPCSPCQDCEDGVCVGGCYDCEKCVGGHCEDDCPYLQACCCNAGCYGYETQYCCDCKICDMIEVSPGQYHGVCCNKKCCDYECCDDKTCYDPNTKKCCNYGTGQTCDKYKECCYGKCCDPNQCKDCNSTSKTCESYCDPDECEECDGEGHCEVCNDDPDQCCDDGTCVDKCTNTGQCSWEPPDTDNYATCENFNPTDKTCEDIIEGALCGHVITVAQNDAECADCAPGCDKTRVCACAQINPVYCITRCYLLVCACLCDNVGDPIFSGDHYECAD